MAGKLNKGRSRPFSLKLIKNMKLESEEYPYCQLNETINMSPTGQILSRSLMLNLRNESPEIVHQNYLKLKQLIDNPGKPEKKVKRSKKETPTENKQTEKDQKKSENCPECGGLLIRKAGISKKNGRSFDFVGCGNWPACSYTRPFISEVKQHEPCDEEIPIEAIPF
jgi:predicted RNA-binding Zn-ribbon protein involved in translation (DUF1610 family)